MTTDEIQIKEYISIIDYTEEKRLIFETIKERNNNRRYPTSDKICLTINNEFQREKKKQSEMIDKKWRKIRHKAGIIHKIWLKYQKPELTEKEKIEDKSISKDVVENITDAWLKEGILKIQTSSIFGELTNDTKGIIKTFIINRDYPEERTKQDDEYYDEEMRKFGRLINEKEKECMEKKFIEEINIAINIDCIKFHLTKYNSVTIRNENSDDILITSLEEFVLKYPEHAS